MQQNGPHGCEAWMATVEGYPQKFNKRKGISRINRKKRKEENN
jgi:hypothetical protein